jgi:riboflavin kinase/FMN adenylyltransferase
MEIIRGESLWNINNKLCITIGTMDGVHSGHLSILKTLKKRAANKNSATALITFKPHPRKILKKTNVELLTLFDEKTDILQRTNLLDYLIIYEFTHEFASTPAEEFIKQISQKASISCIVLGYDNHFGKNREGNFDWLKEYGKHHNIEIFKVDAVTLDGEKISSSLIRNLIKEGDLHKAAKLLGYNYFITGIVGKGKNIGNKIGFPTANLVFDKDKLLPPHGIYAGLACINGKKYPAAINIGYNPTVSNDNNLKTEVHLIDFHENIYGKKLRAIFIEKIRDEKKFESLEKLKAAINNDIKQIKQIIPKYEVKCFEL